jgi:hypothetical protein
MISSMFFVTLSSISSLSNAEQQNKSCYAFIGNWNLHVDYEPDKRSFQEEVVTMVSALIRHQETRLGDHDKIIVQFNKFAIPMTFEGHAHHYYRISSPLPALALAYRRPPADLPAN